MTSLLDYVKCLEAGGRVAPALLSHGAVRIGETTVLSRSVHTQEAQEAGTVAVLRGADAGRAFYHRRHPGEVLHLDIFHDLGEADQHGLAQAIRAAILEFAAAGNPEARRLVDYIDLQTGRGGGRLSGSLINGGTRQLRLSHRNHVHLAAAIPDQLLPVVFYLVAAVEEELCRQGLQLRRIERIKLVPGGSAPLDLSAYGAATDSYLRQEGGGQAGRLASAEGRGAIGELAALAEELGGVAEVRSLLDTFSRYPATRDYRTGCLRDWEKLQSMNRLQEKGIIDFNQSDSALTERGRQLLRTLELYGHEVELEFRRLLRNTSRLNLPARHGLAHGGRTRVFGSGPVRAVATPDRGVWVSDLAVAETAQAAALRSLGQGERISFRPEDLRQARRWRDIPQDTCLLVDASASMAGKRIKAARYLAEHLLLTTRDRVAVIIFQDRSVEVRVPFTRSFARAEEGLGQIKPQGLTPLAQGVMTALEYLKSARARNPLLLVVTDGIPTVPQWTLNPLDDALRAAREIAQRQVRLACIGLEPNRHFLSEFVELAGGSLYVVSELEHWAMVDIAHQERTGSPPPGKRC